MHAVYGAASHRRNVVLNSVQTRRIASPNALSAITSCGGAASAKNPGRAINVAAINPTIVWLTRELAAIITDAAAAPNAIDPA